MKKSLTISLLFLAWFVSLGNQQAAGQNQLTTLEGQFVGVRGQLMQVKGSDEKMYLILMPNELSSVNYSGTAKPAWLRPGMFVRFEGTFDERGISQEPIKEIEAFTPDKRHTQPDQLADTTPGIYPLGGEAGAALFGGEEGAKRKKPATASKFKIVGQVAGMGRKGELGVMTGPRQVMQVQLTEETQIKLAMQGPQFAMPGDRVVVDGYYNPPVETNITANSIRISAADVLGQAPPKPVRKTARQRREEAAAAKEAQAKAVADKEPATEEPTTEEPTTEEPTTEEPTTEEPATEEPARAE